MSAASSRGELVLYRTEDGRDAIQLRVVDGTVWLTQAEIAALFETTSQNVNQHLRTIFDDRELDEAATCKDFLQVQRKGLARSFARSRSTISTPSWPLAIAFAVRVAVSSGAGRARYYGNT